MADVFAAPQSNAKLAFTGLGRIGKAAFREFFSRGMPGQIVAINDLMNNKQLAHAIMHDSNFGAFKGIVEPRGNDILRVQVNGSPSDMQVFSEKDPAKINWGALGADIVIDSTGKFLSPEKAQVYLDGGAKKVLLSAPPKCENGEIPQFVLGVNDHLYDPKVHHVISNASCTTNCLAPVAKVLHDNFTILEGDMLTVHAYTNDQKLIDSPHDDLRRSRSAADSIIPTKTGAAKSIGEIIPELKGKLDGMCMRVPVSVVSTIYLVVALDKPASKEAINAAFAAASETGPLAGIMGFSTMELVSVDFKCDPRSSIVDAAYTKVSKGGKLARVVSWYDNEWAYANRFLELAMKVGSQL